MKRISIVLIIALALVAGVMAAEEVPQMPDEYKGTVTIDGKPAPAGTTITALIDGEVAGTVTTDEPGIFGGDKNTDQNLAVTGYASDIGKTITFTVNGKAVQATAIFSPGEQHTLAIAATGGGTTPGGTTGGSTGGSTGGGGGSSSPQVVLTTAPALEAAAATTTLQPAPAATEAAKTPEAAGTTAPVEETAGGLNTLLWPAGAVVLLVAAIAGGIFWKKNQK